MLKLTMEIVPRSSWGDNVRSHVSTKTWDKLRTAAYAAYEHKCGVCGKGHKKLEAHEIWDYNDETGVQKLVGMIALCSMCHRCKHIGLTELLASKGKIKIVAVMAHYCRVNKCDNAQFMRDRNAAFELWAQRSQRSWTVDISWLENYG
jgi:hypothetical protein